jgi:hypothetical protein
MQGLLTLADRWAQGAWFLSLKLTRPFFADLWVPIDNGAHLQNGLRELLVGSVSEAGYYAEQAALGWRVMDWYQSTYGWESFHLLNLWIHSILLLEGPDRPGETFWTPLSFELARRFESNVSTPNSIVMTSVVSFERVKRSEFEKRVETVEDHELDTWDERVLIFRDSSADSVMTKVSLIGEYNIFLTAWEIHCSDLEYAQLYQLWEVGKEVAIDLGMEASDLVFPGSWRFEVPQLLSRFTSP